MSEGCAQCLLAETAGTARCEAGEALYEDWRQRVLEQGAAYERYKIAQSRRPRYGSSDSVEREIARTGVLKDRAYAARQEALTRVRDHVTTGWLPRTEPNEKSPATAAHG